MRSALKQYLQERLEEWALPHLAGALSGDIDSAERLVASAGNENRGRLALALWRCRIEPAAYRAVLAAAWSHDHGWVIGYAHSRRTLHAMFRYAAFPTDHLPKRMTVWRGTRNIQRDKAAGGYSWTLSRDVACWFALRRRGPNDQPLVLSVDVVRSDVVYSSNERDEKEIVLMKHPIAKVDKSPGDWSDVADRHERHNQEEKHARLEELRRRRETHE